MIDIPDFGPQHLDLSRFGGDIGAAFQAFVGELLVAEGIDTHVFPAGGKDGGIDLVEELEGGGLRGYECKVTSEDDVLKAARQRWNKTADNLTRNLASADGPPHRPKAVPPVVRYRPPDSRLRILPQRRPCQ